MGVQYWATRDVVDGDREGESPAVLVEMLTLDDPPRVIHDPVLVDDEVVEGCWVLAHWDPDAKLGVYYALQQRGVTMTESEASAYLADGLEPPAPPAR